VRAAPDSFFAVAFSLQDFVAAAEASFSHLVTKLVRAAPDRFFSVACVSQAGFAAHVALIENAAMAAISRRFSMSLLSEGWTAVRILPNSASLRHVSGARVPGSDVIDLTPHFGAFRLQPVAFAADRRQYYYDDNAFDTRRMMMAEWIQAIAAVIGTVIAGLGFYYVVQQLIQNRDATKNQTRWAIAQVSCDVYRVFVDKPELALELSPTKARRNEADQAQRKRLRG